MAAQCILLVEDERVTREALVHVLGSEGYSVEVATSIAEATACLDTSTYALAIMNWRLPDGDGLLIANRAAAAGAKTMVMSGYLFQMPGRLAEHHEILMKPIRPSEMVAAVERALGKPAFARDGAKQLQDRES
jgi:DNA-binding response OmpR family regulator